MLRKISFLVNKGQKHKLESYINEEISINNIANHYINKSSETFFFFFSIYFY